MIITVTLLQDILLLASSHTPAHLISSSIGISNDIDTGKVEKTKFVH